MELGDKLLYLCPIVVVLGCLKGRGKETVDLDLVDPAGQLFPAMVQDRGDRVVILPHPTGAYGYPHPPSP